MAKAGSVGRTAALIYNATAGRRTPARIVHTYHGHVLEGYFGAPMTRVGRIALYSWFYHNFGLDWYQQPNTLMFQDQPLAQDCDNWRAQSPHRGGLNVALNPRLAFTSVSM